MARLTSGTISELKALTSPETGRRRWRQRWLAVHLYLGLSIGVVFALAGLTGSLLVFYVELDEVINPQLAISVEQARQPAQPLEIIFQAVKAAHPERTGAWRLEMPRHPRAMIMARYYKAKEKEHVHFAPLMAWVNPYTAEVASSRFWGDYLMTWIYDLHYELLLDKAGKIIMGVIGLFLIITSIIGIYLWWPKAGKIKSALTFKANASRERFHYDLHKVSGVYSLAVLLLLLVSGVVLELPDYVNPAINRVSPLYKPGKNLSSLPADKVARISVDQAVASAARVYPDGKLRWIETPADATDSYIIRFYQDGEPSQRFPKSTAWIDQYSGELIATRNPLTENSAGDTFINWMHPLHSGEIAGITGRIIVLISGIIPFLLFYTGLIRWLQKRRAKKRKPSNRHRPAPAR